MTGDLGLSPIDLALIRSALDRIPGLRKAVVFGSRAKGSQRPGSDVDLALYGDSLAVEDLIQLGERLNEEAPLPYRFDVVHYESIELEELRSHIDRVGKCVWPGGSEGQ